MGEDVGRSACDDETGATSAEAVAIIVLVSALIAAVWSAGIDRRVGEEAEVAVCNLFQTDADCEPADDGSGGTDQGPPGGEVPLDLPDTESMLGDVVERCGVAVADWETTIHGLGVTGGGSIGNVGVTASGDGGVTTSGSLTTTPDHIAAIRDGDAPPPDPFDPTTLPPGAAIELGREHFESLGLGASYGALGLELGFGTSEEWSIGVVRNDDGTVQLLIGESSAIRNSLGVGVGVGWVAVSAAVGNELTRSDIRYVDIDVSSPGGLETYLDALTAQSVPDRGATGVTGSGTITKDVYESMLELGISLTPSKKAEMERAEAELGVLVAEASSSDTLVSNSVTWVVGDDGSVSSVVVLTSRGSTMTIASSVPSTDADRSYSLVLEGVSGGAVETFAELTGHTVVADDRATIRLDLTHEQLYAIQEMVRAVEADSITGSSVRDLILMEAENANEILLALHAFGTGTIEHLTNVLGNYAYLTGQDLEETFASLGLLPQVADADGCFAP